jgi:hypothetical protein
MQKVGKVQSSGIELGLNSAVTAALELGGNYTLTVLKNVSDPATKLTSIPRHKLTAHALYKVGDALDIIGFVESNSSRWASNTVELAGFTTLNLKAVYRASKAISTEVGVNNLSDHNYSLADGYPSRFNNNNIYQQLDLLFEFSQWSLRRAAASTPHLRLWRGSNQCEEQIVDGSLQSRHCTVRLNNIVSFSRSQEDASCFGDWVFEVQVPTCKVLVYPELLPGQVLQGEQEVLALGGNYEVTASYA